MAKISSKKKSAKQWVCNEGCKVTSRPCPHLEKLLPKINEHGQVALKINLSYLENMPAIPADEYDEKVAKLTKNLQKLGLDDWKIDLLLDRFISKLTIKEIADKNGFVGNKLDVSGRVVITLIENILHELRFLGSKTKKQLRGDSNE